MDGFYHPLSLFLNIWFCKKIRNKISEQVVKSQKIGVRTYLLFLVCVIFLIGFNQALFLMIEKPNLYEQIQCPRTYSLSQVKEHGDDMKVGIMSLQGMPLHRKIVQVKKLQQIINVLSHPARRLSYDAFGHSQTQYAWAFKSQQFLLQMVVQSALFYVICTGMSLMNTKKTQMKDTLKTQILVMILLFVWQIDIIMTTQTKLHMEYTDIFDKIYFALPIFERRQMLKSILIPTMNMVDIFIVFFIKNDTYKKIERMGTNDQLRLISNPVRSSLAQIKAQDEHFEQKISLKIDQFQQNDRFRAQVFRYNRQIVRCLFVLGMDSILLNPQMRRICQYFKFSLVRQNH